jgi:hypothetical protein
VDLDKARIPHGFEVAIEAGVRIGSGVDKGIGKVNVEAIHALQHQGVGIQDPDLFDQVRPDIGAATHAPILGEQLARKGWRGIEAVQIKGPQRCRTHLISGGARKHHAHERLHDLLVLGHDRTVRDGCEQRRGLLQRLVHFGCQRSLHRMLTVHSLLPERHQWCQAELSRKGEGIVGARWQSDRPVAAYRSLLRHG